MGIGTDRRGFIQGLFGGVTAGGILLYTNTEVVADEVGLWKPNMPLLVAPPQASAAAVRLGSVLFDHAGRPVAVVKGINCHRQAADYSEWGSHYERMAPGPWRGTIAAEMFGPVDTVVNERHR